MSSLCGEQVVAGYFPLSACVQGMCLVVESLFGMHMRPVEAHPGETWAPDVAKYALFSSSGRAEVSLGHSGLQWLSLL